MQTYSQAIAATATWRLGVPGSYFRLLSLTGAVDVQFLRNGTVIFTAGQVLDGFWSKPDGGFDEIIVTSATAQTVTLGITTGNAGYDRSAGNVAVTNQPALRGAFTQANVAVAAVTGLLLNANAARRYLLIQNNHATATVYVTLDGTAATTAKGLKIPAGGSYEIGGFGYMPIDQINVIGSAANANVVVVEG